MTAHPHGLLDTSVVVSLAGRTDANGLLPFDDRAARGFGKVAAELRGASRKPAERAYDALIAATAVANELPIFTCNPADFSGIESLVVVAV